MNKKFKCFMSSFLLLVVLLGFGASTLSMSASEVPNNPYGIPNSEYVPKNNGSQREKAFFIPAGLILIWKGIRYTYEAIKAIFTYQEICRNFSYNTYVRRLCTGRY